MTNNLRNTNIGILITTISIMSGALLNSRIINDVIEQSRVAGVLFVEISFVMLFGSIMYHIASVQLSDRNYSEISIMQALISIGILAGLVMFWASLYIVSRNPQNLTPGELMGIYVLIFVILSLVIYSQFDIKRLIKNIQRLYGVVIDQQSILNTGMITLSLILMGAFVYNGISHAFTLLLIIMLPAFGIKTQKEAQKRKIDEIMLYRVSLFLLSMTLGTILTIAYILQNKCYLSFSIRLILDISIIIYTAYAFFVLYITRYDASKFHKLHINVAWGLGLLLMINDLIQYYLMHSKTSTSCFGFLEIGLVLYTIVTSITYERTVRKVANIFMNRFSKERN